MLAIFLVYAYKGCLFFLLLNNKFLLLALTIGLHADGVIHFLNRNLQLTNFRAYQCRVSHLIQLKQHNILISVGDDDESGPIAKVWNCDKVLYSNSNTSMSMNIR
jgi:hypothetical protein